MTAIAVAGRSAYQAAASPRAVAVYVKVGRVAITFVESIAWGAAINVAFAGALRGATRLINWFANRSARKAAAAAGETHYERMVTTPHVELTLERLPRFLADAFLNSAGVLSTIVALPFRWIVKPLFDIIVAGSTVPGRVIVHLNKGRENAFTVFVDSLNVVLSAPFYAASGLILSWWNVSKKGFFLFDQYLRAGTTFVTTPIPVAVPKERKERKLKSVPNEGVVQDMYHQTMDLARGIGLQGMRDAAAFGTPAEANGEVEEELADFEYVAILSSEGLKQSPTRVGRLVAEQMRKDFGEDMADQSKLIDARKVIQQYLETLKLTEYQKKQFWKGFNALLANA